MTVLEYIHFRMKSEAPENMDSEAMFEELLARADGEEYADWNVDRDGCAIDIKQRIDAIAELWKTWNAQDELLDALIHEITILAYG